MNLFFCLYRNAQSCKTGAMSNLTGFWEGRFAYANDWQSPVGFDVDLSQNGSRLSGIISEPNTFDTDAGHMLTAALAGQLSGGQVSFTKTYVGEGHAQHSVSYEGTVSDKNARISGKWKIGAFSGEFEMTRLSGGEKALHKAAEHITI